MCGIFGITNSFEASKLVYLGLFALQHRGQESAGISILNTAGGIETCKGAGLVSDVFDETSLTQLPGLSGIGHVRYSTAGGNSIANMQPLSVRLGKTQVALAHNGNLVNEKSLSDLLEKSGAIFQGTADSEIILHLLARSEESTFDQKLLNTLASVRGAFSLLILTSTHLYAAMDPCGYRPLLLGKMNVKTDDSRESSADGAAKSKTSTFPVPSWVVSSESCALDLVGAQFVRDLLPGEVLSIHLETGTLKSEKLPNPMGTKGTQGQSHCSFEHIYFARPDSSLWGANVIEVREKLGVVLAKNDLAKKDLAKNDSAKNEALLADVVIAVPDSGIPMAMGYAQYSKIPFATGFIRNHYVGRTFIEPTQAVRNFRVRLKLNPVRSVVEGKRLIVIDDSIVRGTTSRKIVELLRDAGAKEVHLRIGSPEVRFPCFYGIDTPKRQDLLAQKMTISEMKQFLNVDSLAFLDAQSLVEVLETTNNQENKTALNSLNKGWCLSCFKGTYQDFEAQSKMENDA